MLTGWVHAGSGGKGRGGAPKKTDKHSFMDRLRDMPVEPSVIPAAAEWKAADAAA